MASIVLSATTNNDAVTSTDTVYATARSGGTLAVSGTTATNSFGQRYNATDYLCSEALLEFDYYAGLIALGYSAGQIATSSISSAILTTTVSAAPDSSFTGRARLYDYGATITTADFVAGASIAAKTLLAHVALTAASTGTLTWVDDAFAANVSKTSTPTRLGLFSQNMEDNVAPADFQRIVILGASGATPPQLTVTYTLASSAGMMMVSD